MSAADRLHRSTPQTDDLLQRETLLPGLALLLDADALAAWLAGRAGLTGAVTRHRMRLKPGTSAVLAAEVDTPEGPVGLVIAAYSADSVAKLDKALTRLPPRAVVAVDPELRVLATRSSADRDLPGLAMLDDPGGRVDLVARAGLPRTGPVGLTRLSHNPHRRWVGTLDPPGAPRVLVRCYRPGHLDTGLAPLRALVGTSAPVPRLLGHRRGGALLMAEHAPGRAVTSEDPEEVLVRTGMALAALHTTPARMPARPHRAERAPVRTARLVGLLLPEQARRARALGRRVATLQVASEDVGPVHGDFSFDQVVSGVDGVRLIDLDHAHRGDPAEDLGSLRAELMLRHADPCATARADTAVLEGYRTVRPAPAESALDRWTAVHLLRRAAQPFRECRPGWADEVTRALDLTDDVLDGARR
jgi:hypothetical protein